MSKYDSSVNATTSRNIFGADKEKVLTYEEPNKVIKKVNTVKKVNKEKRGKI